VANRLFERNLANWIVESGNWAWDPIKGHWERGAARVDAAGIDNVLLSALADVAPDDEIKISLGVMTREVGYAPRYPGTDTYPSPFNYPVSGDNVADDPDAVVMRWGVRFYSNDTLIDTEVLDEIPHEDAITYTFWEDRDAIVTVPDGVNRMRVFLQVTGAASEGQLWFDGVSLDTTDTTVATVFKALQTRSSFAKVAVDFKDSGLVRGDSMWADINPDSQSIDDTQLAYYTRTIPETMPGGTWGDTQKTWASEEATWGSPYQLVGISVDPGRRYQGKRVLRFRRDAGAGEAGIKVKQWTNFVPQGLFRIGAVFYKPVANDNMATVRLRRISDGVIVYEETVNAPAGRWHEFTTKFVEIPAGDDQDYEVHFTLEGDDEDEVYLSDLYTDVALVRYFVRLGSVGAYLHEVTDLRYADGRAVLTTTTPVTDVSVTATILSPRAWAYGCRVTPYYLK
jgi:hypothetical protein